jgi:hypothetical protein
MTTKRLVFVYFFMVLSITSYGQLLRPKGVSSIEVLPTFSLKSVGLNASFNHMLLQRGYVSGGLGTEYLFLEFGNVASYTINARVGYNVTRLMERLFVDVELQGQAYLSRGSNEHLGVYQTIAFAEGLGVRAEYMFSPSLAISLSAQQRMHQKDLTGRFSFFVGVGASYYLGQKENRLLGF